MSKDNETDASRFIEALSPLGDGFQFLAIRYFGIEVEGGIAVLSGSLRLEPDAGNESDDWSHACGTLHAGRVRRRMSCAESCSLIEQLVTTGAFHLEGKQFLLPTEDGKAPSSFLPGPDLNPPNGIFGMSLQVTGKGRHAFVRNPDVIDLQLRISDAPFRSIQELLGHVGLPNQLPDHMRVEIIATAVAEIILSDAETRIEGDRAKIAVVMSPNLDPGSLKLGWRLLVNGVAHRSSQSGKAIHWTPEGAPRRGTFEIDVPKQALLECFLSYRERLQHQWWVVESGIIHNPRRVVHEAFDPKLERLEQLLFDPTFLKGDSRKFEEGVTYLLALLGFRATRYDKPLADAPDVVVSTAAGDIALVECTTSSFDGNKLSKLAARAKTVRARLDASAHVQRRILPLMVTSLSRAEVEGELENALKMGIVVVTSENLRGALPQTLFDADPHLQIYEQGFAELSKQGEFLFK